MGVCLHPFNPCDPWFHSAASRGKMRTMATKTSFTYKLTPAQQDALENVLRTGNYRPVRVEHARMAAEGDRYRVVLYRSGSCVVQGRNAEEFVTFTMEPLVLMAAELGYEDVLDPEATQPHIGIDESGKGDFFGPLVVAGAYVDPELAATMREMDVKDSKRITSDDKALGLGSELRRLLGDRFTVVKIGPAAYNRLYHKMRNVNRMLAWAHARAIENLLEAIPGCPRAISDQFGSKRQVEQALMKKGASIELVQMHKAESDLAVAAASIIAREIFLRSLKQLGEQHGITMPKGASAGVREWAVELARKKGPAVLAETVKCHFKTTDQVLKALSLDRKALPEEARAVSKAYTYKPRKKTE